MGTGVARKPSLGSKLMDFGNLLKSFVGTQYMTLSYGFLQSGIVLGFVIIGLVGALTTHCCELIVKCKYYVIEDTVQRLKKENAQINDPKVEHDIEAVRDAMARRLTIVDIAHCAYGRAGSILVTLCLLVTQAGFCVAYHIFIGNVLWAIFCKPVDTSSTNTGSDTGGLVELVPILNNSLHTKQGGATDTSPLINNLTNIGDNLSYNSTLILSSNSSLNSSSVLIPDSEYHELSVWTWLSIFVVAPLPVFMAFTLFRKVRSIGHFSIFANFVIGMCFVLILVYLGIDFSVAPGVEWFAWSTCLIMVGQAVASYEAVGTLLFIEGSMEGNRANFVPYLRWSIFSFTALFAPMAMLGYLRYGTYTAQILLLDLPQDPLVVAAETTTIVGVMLTYPIQVYPVTEIIEQLAFGKIVPTGDDSSGGVVGHDHAPLLRERDILEEVGVVVTTVVPKTTATWKRNLLRVCVAVIICGLAVVFESAFAYASALVGALGSTPLAFIFPCVFQLRLRHSSLSRGVVVKDVAIIVVSTLACLAILCVDVVEVIKLYV